MKRESQRKFFLVVAAIVLTCAVSGFFMGLRGNRSRISLTRPVGNPTADSVRRAAEAPAGVPVAVRYSEVDRRKSGPNAGWINEIANLAPASHPGTGPLAATEAERAAAQSRRAARRSFDGAPPVIPHPIQQDSSAACLACHGEGLQIKDRSASRISHPHFANCTQCHVAATPPGLTRDPGLLAPLALSTFVGSTPTAGKRATPGAPPTIPHPTALRSDCLSCHGPAGAFGLRTPHPERQSCLQCHVPDAAVEQSPVLRGAARPPAKP